MAVLMRSNIILYTFGVLVRLFTICVSNRACSALFCCSVAILMLRLLLLLARNFFLTILIRATWLATHKATSWLFMPNFLLIVTLLSILSLSGWSNLFQALFFQLLSIFLLSNNICSQLRRKCGITFLIRSVLFTYDLLIGT